MPSSFWRASQFWTPSRAIHVSGALFAFCIFAPIFVMALDRDPPFIRLYGSMVPDTVPRGGEMIVRYVVTRRDRSRDCPDGEVQQEIVDSQRTIYSKLAREIGPAKWEPDPEHPGREIFYGRPVSVPLQAAPGPAIFRTVTFRRCNALQRLMHWPIVQIGPDIKFTITDETVSKNGT